MIQQVIQQAFDANINTTVPVGVSWDEVGYAHYVNYKFTDFISDPQQKKEIKSANLNYNPPVGADVSSYYTMLLVTKTDEGWYVLGDDWVHALFLAHP
jgi:hypothetical protein